MKDVPSTGWTMGITAGITRAARILINTTYVTVSAEFIGDYPSGCGGGTDDAEHRAFHKDSMAAVGDVSGYQSKPDKEDCLENEKPDVPSS